MNVGSLQCVDDVEMSDPFLTRKDSPNDIDFQLDHLQPKQKTEMENLLNNYKYIFSTNSGDLGLTSVSQHKIETRNAVRADKF